MKSNCNIEVVLSSITLQDNSIVDLLPRCKSGNYKQGEIISKMQSNGKYNIYMIRPNNRNIARLYRCYINLFRELSRLNITDFAIPDIIDYSLSLQQNAQILYKAISKYAKPYMNITIVCMSIKSKYIYLYYFKKKK